MMRTLFFQAEDGIRDYKVTGVQTCALPISEDWQKSVEVVKSYGCPILIVRFEDLIDRAPVNVWELGAWLGVEEERRMDMFKVIRPRTSICTTLLLEPQLIDDADARLPKIGETPD